MQGTALSLAIVAVVSIIELCASERRADASAIQNGMVFAQIGPGSVGGTVVDEPEKPASIDKERPTPPNSARKFRSRAPEQIGPTAHSHGQAETWDPYDYSRRVTPGGRLTCGPRGCDTVPVGCQAVRGVPGGHGLGGKIFCP
jgi:hypothetical protein